MTIKHKRIRNFRTRPSAAKTVIITDKLDVFRLRNYSTNSDPHKNDYSFIIEHVYEDRCVMNAEEYSASKVRQFDQNTTQSSSWSLDRSQQFESVVDPNNGNQTSRKTMHFDIDATENSSWTLGKISQSTGTVRKPSRISTPRQLLDSTVSESIPWSDESSQFTSGISPKPRDLLTKPTPPPDCNAPESSLRSHVQSNHNNSAVVPAIEPKSLSFSTDLGTAQTLDVTARQKTENSAWSIARSSYCGTAVEPTVEYPSSRQALTFDFNLTEEDSSQSFEKSIRSSTAATAIRDSVSAANPKEESEAFHTANDLQFSTSAQAVCDSVSTANLREESEASLIANDLQLIAASKPIRDSVPTPNLIEESESYSLADFDRLLSHCDEARVLEWTEFLPGGDCKKLGEGVSAEVFKFSLDGVETAVKIIPFMDQQCFYDGLVNGEPMKQTFDIVPEVVITKELSDLADREAKALVYSTPSFIRPIKIAVVRGDYPETLLAQWDKFDKLKESDNDRPDKYSSPNQLFMVYALAFGGRDLESFTIRNEKEAFSIFFQIAMSLAVAEETLEFEHRDLHIGNVLISQCPAAEVILNTFETIDFKIKSHGVKVTIIDFTLSRMRKGGTTFFQDLSNDEEQFEGSGDYQFDIYRMMRQRNNNEWTNFNPVTNVLWLHYLATKLFCAKKIQPKRRKEILLQMDDLLRHERIKEFLKKLPVQDIFEKFLVV